MKRFALLVLAACHHDPQPATLTNHTAATPVDPPPPETACEHYDNVVQRALACTELPEDIRNRIAQDQTDTHASLAENGLDGDRKDPDEVCTDATVKVTIVAEGICPW